MAAAAQCSKVHAPETILPGVLLVYLNPCTSDPTWVISRAAAHGGEAHSGRHHELLILRSSPSTHVPFTSATLHVSTCVIPQLRMEEKRIVGGTMDAVRARLAPIRGIPTKQGNLADPNQVLRRFRSYN